MTGEVPSPSLTAADLAAVYRIPLGTIYAWASTDKWRRTTTRPKRYYLDDVQASYERRRQDATKLPCASVVTTRPPAPKIRPCMVT